LFECYTNISRSFISSVLDKIAFILISQSKAEKAKKGKVSKIKKNKEKQQIAHVLLSYREAQISTC